MDRRPLFEALALAPRAILYRCARAVRIAELYASQLLNGARSGDEAIDAILSRRTGIVRATGKQAAVFCHFDPNGDVSAAAHRLIASLAEAGLDVIAVSNAPSLSDESAARLAQHSVAVLHRRNVGYDFGAYRDGLAELGDLSAYQRIVLVNDSVIGPFARLEPLLARMDDTADVWGLTDSPERGWHLQSYFLAFGPRAVSHQAFRDFWQSYRSIGSKDRAVHAGELALSHALKSGGLRLRALFPFERVRKTFISRAEADGRAPRFAPRGAPRDADHVLAASLSALPFNPTHLYWDTLIEAFGFPFVKRDLADVNPARLISANDVARVVDARFGAGAWADSLGDSAAPIAPEISLR